MPRPRKNCLPKIDSPSKNTRQKKAQTIENVTPNIKSPNDKIKQINNNQDKSPNPNNTGDKLDTASKLKSPNRKKAIIKTYQAVHRKSKAEHEMSPKQSKVGEHLSLKPTERTPLNNPSTDINTGPQIPSTDKKLTKEPHIENDHEELKSNTPIGNTKKRKQPPRNAKTPPKKEVPTKKPRMGHSKPKVDESNTNKGNISNVRESELNLTELEIDERKISSPVKSTSTKQMEYNNSSKVRTKNHQTYNTKKKVIKSVKPIISKQKHLNNSINEEPSCNKETEKESLSKNDEREASPKKIDMAITKQRDSKKNANTVNIKNLPNSKNKPLSKTTKVKDVSVTESEDKSLPFLAIDDAETSRTENSNLKKKTPPCAKITSPKKVTASNKSQKLSPKSAKRKKSPQKPAIKNTKKNKNKMIDQYDDTQEETKEKDNESVMRVEHEYIADGFKDDCELFIRKCQCVSQLNFEKFCMIWKSMEFAHLYRGRQSGAEIAELSEELIFVAKSYMIATDRTFEVNVAGLFLVYALLNLQPYKGFAALRLVPNDVEAILALESEARRQRRLDIIYILGHVLIVGPCQFHVLVRECALENPIRKYFDGSVVPTDASTLPIGVLSNNNEALSLIKTVTTLDHKYSEAKRKLQERFGADPSLNFASNTGEELQESVQDVLPELMTLQHRIANKIKHQSYEVERQDTLKSIKDKAMGNVVNTIKFLTGVNDRKNIQSPPSPLRPKNKKKHASRHSAKSLIKVFGCSDESNKNNPDLTGTTSKNVLDTEEQNEACSLRKRISSQDSPSQRKTDSISPSKAKRKSKHIIRNSFDNDSFETSTDINTDTEDGNDKTNDSTDTPNISNNMNMPLLAMNEAETPTTDSKDTNSINEVIKETNSERTIIPAIVHDGGDARRVIEVEIIDDLNKPNDVLDYIRHKSIDSSVGEEIDEHLDSEDSNITPLSGLFVNQRQILSKDKRGFKRTHVRSKFKKQGLLTVANFENSHEDDLIESNLE